MIFLVTQEYKEQYQAWKHKNMDWYLGSCSNIFEVQNCELGPKGRALFVEFWLQKLAQKGLKSWFKREFKKELLSANRLN